MQERTEADIIAKAPIKVMLGEQEYSIKPLSIGRAAAWRKQAVEAVQTIVEVHAQECTSNNAFTQGLAFFFLRFPEKMLDLVCSYATDLVRETVMDEATDEQLAKAFGEIIKIAFPFMNELGAISNVMGIATSFQASGKSTRLPS